MPNLNKFYQIIKCIFLLSVLLSTAACTPDKSEQQMLLDTKSYLDNNNPAAASIELRNLLKKNNGNTEAHYLLGKIHLILGNVAIAEKEFNRAAQTGWAQEQTQIALARTYITARKFQKLLDNISLQETWSANTKANISALRALSLAGLNQASPAKTTLKKAHSYKKDALEVFKTTAIFQLSELQDGNPSETLKQALSSHPENSKILLLLATDHIKNKEHSAAAEIYRKILSTAPANLITTSVHEARIGLARLQITEKKLDKANSTLAPLLKSNEKNPEANYLSALISFSKNDYGHAEGYTRNLLAVLPNHHPSQLLMGKIKYALKEFEQASHHISLYLKSAPDDLSAQILLTQIYIGLAQPDKASSTLQPILKGNPRNTFALALQSQIAFLNSDADKGIRTLEEAIQITPNDSVLQKQLVKAYIANGNTTKALQKLKIFKSLSNTPASQKLTISAYLADGKINQALKIATQMLDESPDDPTTLALNGSLHAANNDLSLAREYFSQARQQQKDLPSAIIGLAHLEEQEGNFDQAITLYKTLIKSEQAGTIPMLALSELAGKQNRSDDMLSWLEKARASTPTDLKSRLILANYYLHQSQADKAETYIKEALKISPENVEVMTIYGRILIAQKRYNEALPTLKTLARKHPDSTIPHLLLGEAFSQLGMVKKAHHHLQAVLKIQPDNIFASVFMAETEFKMGNYNNSIKYAKNLQKTQPKLLTGYLLEGNIWLARKNHNKAYSAYTLAWKQQQTADLAKKLFATSKSSTPLEKTVEPLLIWLEQHPEDYNTRLFLATAYQSKKHNDKAIHEYESILKQNTDVSSALNNLAWLYSLSNNSKALDMAERAYRLAPENPGIQDTYGWILSKQGQAEKGLRLLEQALQTLPNNPDIRFHHASALIKSGKKARGKQVLKELLDRNKIFESREQVQNLLRTISD
jgi:putative PEP-CTERM system TPR-repeat lipoprotein